MNRYFRSSPLKSLLRNRSGYLTLLWWLACAAILGAGLNGWWQRGHAAAAGPLAQERQAFNDIWQALERAPLEPQTNTGLPAQARVYQLNQDALVQVLNRAPLEFSGVDGPILPLPLPDGTFARFVIEESPALEPSLAARFPEIKSYRGQGLDDAALTMRCDLSPRGFYAFILAGGETINVQPVNGHDYVSFAGSAVQDGNFECLVRDIHETNSSFKLGNGPGAVTNVALGPTLRNYRIAIAATWEYCNQYGGGTNAGTIASLNTWLNAANVVYERELTVHLNLVDSTNVLYTSERGFSAASDPYDNTSPVSMLDQVRPDLRDKIGVGNYDIGHVFGQIAGTGGSGVAFLGVTCRNTDNGGDGLGPLKGGGATLLGGAAANSTALGVWVHELGHQFGSNHNFNGTQSNCNGANRNAATAYETGSGSTIMAYSAICGADNITNTRDMRFHAASYAQITSYIASSATCFSGTGTGNNSPTVNGGADFTIPRQTPFTLTATGSDPDAGDAPNLTYTWDQLDSGGTLYPQNGTSASYNDAADPATTTRPIFRSFPVSSSPARTFPSLGYILNNANDPPDIVNGLQTAEELPRIGRTLNFRVLIRDNRAGNGGVNEDSVQLTVSGGAGPFLVTAPNSPLSWTGNTAQTVTWSVNNTNVAPVNAANVRILLSTDGGQTFPTVIAASTPNDGSETISVPNTPTTTARIKVEALGNIFFDISDTNFTITLGSGCAPVTVNPSALTAGTVGTGYSQAFTQTGGPGTITWSFTGTLPPGLSLDPSSGLLSGTPTQNGTFNFTITATATGNCTGSRDYALTINCPALTVNPSALTAGTVGTGYSQPFTQTGGAGTITWSFTGTLPPGISLNPSSGLLSGTPTQSGTFNFTVSATGQSNCAGSRVYTLVIDCPTITLNPATLANGVVGTAYTATISAAPAGGNYTFTITSGNLPAGLSLNPTTGALTGAPTTPGTLNFTLKATGFGICTNSQPYSITITAPGCPVITVSPTNPNLASSVVGAAYNQNFTQSGGTGTITWSISAGTQPAGLLLDSTTGVLSGNLTAVGVFTFTVRATAAGNCIGSRQYIVVISGNGLQFYPLAHPIRLIDTRAPIPGATACAYLNQPLLADQESAYQARLTCGDVTIPANAQAIVGNATVVTPASSGYITLWPNGQARPTVSNLNYLPGQIVPNSFTVGLGSDGRFKVYSVATTDFIVDVTGYFAPPGAGGLYYHALPLPLRLFDTRAPIPGATACAYLNQPLAANSELARPARITCGALTIPADAQVITGNATVVNPANAGYITLWPNGQPRPTVSNLNYLTGQIVPNAFTVGLGSDGQFRVYSTATTDFIVDVAGYYSASAVDENGSGLLYTPLAQPIRLFDTRAPIPGATACAYLNQPLAANSELVKPARITCGALTIPAAAEAIVGNATVVNPTANGYITLWPNGQARPTVSNLNYLTGQIVPNAFTVGLGSDGQFRIYSVATTDFIVDVAGYYAP